MRRDYLSFQVVGRYSFSFLSEPCFGVNAHVVLANDYFYSKISEEFPLRLSNARVFAKVDTCTHTQQINRLFKQN